MPSHLRRYDEPGHTHFWTISCHQRLGFFYDDGMKQVVVESLRMLQQKFGICLIGYVVMPDHLHVLLYPHKCGVEEPIPISKLLHAFKQYVGYHGKERLREYWREHGRLWSEPLNRWARGESGERVILNRRGYDFNVDRQERLIEKLDYCHKNPIARGLADRAEDWVWSSYRYYETKDRTVLEMDWDGGWPIIWQ